MFIKYTPVVLIPLQWISLNVFQWFLREALFPSGSEEKLMFVLRPSVRPSVRKIIDFCEEDLEAWTRLLSTGSLNL